MAILHQTTLTPTKLELLARWLPQQTWFDGDPAALAQVGSFRFDDPDDAVGVETLLLTAGDERVLQVPLTYRDSPVEAQRSALVGRLEHGVLGERWVYDAAADPVYTRALTECILFGHGEASRITDHGGDLTLLENDTRVRGSGMNPDDLDSVGGDGAISSSITRIATGMGVIELVRSPSVEVVAPERVGILVGTWPEQQDPVLLAALRVDREALHRTMRR